MDAELEKYEPSDFDYIVGALAYAEVEGLTLDELSTIIRVAKSGKEFDAGVCATIELKELVVEAGV